MDLAYYKINKLLWCWSRKEGARIVREAKLSMERAPPALPTSSTPAPVAKVTPPPRQPKPEPMVKMVNDLGKVVDAFVRFKTWLDTPDPPKQPKSPKPAEMKEEKVETVPPFDIQEIPGAMRKEHMSVGAKLMERWFAGRLNYSSTDADERAEINQDGKPYPPDMYDMTTIKLDWILKYQRAKEQYEKLIKMAIYSEPAKIILRRKLSMYKNMGDFHANEICNDDLRLIHHYFEFQRSPVGTTISSKISQFIETYENNGVPNDLVASLGSFNFYASIATSRFKLSAYTRQATAELTGIWVYIKDNYTFGDMEGQPSQYLGHWGERGVIIVPAYAGANAIGKSWPNYPVAVGDSRIKSNLYYPVCNSNFRRWQIKHKRGGDFVIYSDKKFVPIFPPIKIPL